MAPCSARRWLLLFLGGEARGYSRDPRARQPRFWARRVLPRAVQVTRRWRVRRTPRASVRPRPSTAVRFFTTISFPQPFPPTPSKATAVARDPHSGAKFGRVALVLATVSKTVSGRFAPTRVRIPPPPFFRRIRLVYRGNRLGCLPGLTRRRRVNERPQTPLLADFIPPPFPRSCCQRVRSDSARARFSRPRARSNRR